MVLLGLKNPKDEIERKRLMIYPNDACKIWWDVIISLFLLVSCFQTPLDLAFPDMFNDF